MLTRCSSIVKTDNQPRPDCRSAETAKSALLLDDDPLRPGTSVDAAGPLLRAVLRQRLQGHLPRLLRAQAGLPRPPLRRTGHALNAIRHLRLLQGRHRRRAKLALPALQPQIIRL